MDVVQSTDGSVRAESIGVSQWLPWALWTLTFVFAAASVVGSPPRDPVHAVGDLGLAVGTMALATIGALVVVRADTQVPGWLLLAFAVPWAATWALYAAVDALVTDDVIDLVQSQVLIGVADALAIGSMLGLFGAFLTVPDGRLPARLGRPLAGFLVIFLAAWVVHTFFLAGQITDPVTYVNRASLASLEGAELGAAFETVTLAMTFVGLLLVIVIAIVLIDRYRSSGPEARQQLKWVLVGAMSVLFWMALWVPQWEGTIGQTAQAVLPGLGLISLAVGFGLALFKYRLWDVDLVIRRSLVYGTLWLVIALVYAGVAAGLGLFAGARFPVGVAIGLTVAATLVFQPARRWLERLADRVVFGERDTPVEAIQTLGSSISPGSPPNEIAGQLARVTRRVLGASAVSVDIDGYDSAVAGAWADGDEITVSISWGEESFGVLRGRARRGERFDDTDIAVVEALASLAALTLSHARLSSRMVGAQEAERRKIERDIHDGVQQDLATQIGQLALARSRVRDDPELAARLAAIQDDMRRALVEIRELAQGIHPSVLRDGGLLAAIEDRCSRLPLPVSINADIALRSGRIDGDIETAAYFTISEAVANVVKHAEATHLSIDLQRVGDELVVEVSDGGIGFDTNQSSHGSGLEGLSDRLRAIGGTLQIESKPELGTVVRARMPNAF